MSATMPPNISRSPFVLLLTTAILGFLMLAYQIGFAPRVRAASSTVVISEVDADTPLAGTDTNNEWFELQNVSTQSITLTNWTITDNVSSDTIPTVTIGPGGHVIVAATLTGFASEHPGFSGTVLAIADGAIGNGLANSGDALTLKDSSGAVVDGLSWGSNTTVLNPSAGVDSSTNTNQRNSTGTDTDTSADWTRAAETPNGIVSPTLSSGAAVISQLYGAGGNSGSTFKNDFVEIFNRGNTSVSLAGWSIQYTSASGAQWSPTALTGTLAPGQYYLVKLAAGGGGTTDLPAPDAIGTTDMNGSQGKIALVSSTTPLSGTCPLGNPQVIDFVGYGAANCFEGPAPAPTLNATQANFRSHQGCKDTDFNGENFVAATPSPRNTAAPLNLCAGDFAPTILGTSPATNETHVLPGTNITINFDEQVSGSGNWFQISCADSGLHTATVSGGPFSFTLNPDVDFGFDEVCAITVFAAQVTDLDLNDPPDNLAADFNFTFTTVRDPAEHMVMGNPSNATPNEADTTNFLLMKPQYALSYNDSRRIPNWTSWHLDSTWQGNAPRQDDFREDVDLPPGFHLVQETDYVGSGFDRGHMCPSADRTSSIKDNSATFVMTNMIPQAPGNNQGPWADLEDYLRTFLPGNEIYIISGGSGVGGIGSNGALNILASGVTVPAITWKVALILPAGDNDLARVDNNTRTIAVIMPNDHAIRFDQWEDFLVTIDQVEAVSGYDFYSNVPTSVQNTIESRLFESGNLQLSSVTHTIGESGGSATITVTRTGDTSGAATFSLATNDSAGSQACNVANGNASSRCDYMTAIGSFSFAPNETLKTITVPVVDDSYAEGNEQFTVTLTLGNAPGTVLGSPSSATVTITDNDLVNGPNPVDQAGFFVRQHYIDFLNREPDASGFDFWTREITDCGTNQQCIEIKRINVSAAFFLSIEFQETGYLVYRMYKAAYGDSTSPNVAVPIPIVRLNEFLPDSQRLSRGVQVGIGDWQAQLEANKTAFALEFVSRQRFLNDFSSSMSPTQFVDKLRENTGSALSQTERDQLVSELTANNTNAGRASVLREIAEDADLQRDEFNRAFVLMQYYGYLRRNPDDPQDTDFRGWKFWLDKLNQFGGNFIEAEMVKAFISSIEYRQRFGP